jgi:hypothetical protein
MELSNLDVVFIAMGIYLFLLFAIAFMTYRWAKSVKLSKT